MITIKFTKNKALLFLLILTISTSASQLLEVKATTAPTLVSPTNNDYINDNTPKLDWSDIMGIEVYQLQVALDSGFTTGLMEEILFAPTPSEYTFGSVLSDDTYYWRVRAYIASQGGWSAYSSVWSFTVDTIAPAAPNIIIPTDHDTVNEPYVEWEVVPTAIRYHVEFDDSVDFSSPLDIRVTGFTHYYYLDPLPDYANNYVRVKAEDAAGNFGPWTEILFKLDTVPPLAPTILSPSEGQLLTERSIYFSWDIVSASEQYHYIQVSRYSDFSSNYLDFVIEHYSEGTTVVVNADGVWYLRIRLKDHAGNIGPWSSRSCTIDSLGPNPPTLISPDDDAHQSDTTPQFQWTAPATADGYHLQIATSNQFTTLVRNITLASTTYTTTTLADDIYYWRVRAEDQYSNWGSWSEIRTLNIDTIVPDTPALYEPVDGYYTSDDTPYLDWFASSGAYSYDVQVSIEETFSSPVIYEQMLTETYYEISSTLSDDTYFWRVRARDLADNVGLWSVIRSFTIDTTPPGIPTLLSPSNTEKLTDSTPLLMWNSVSGATEYQLQIDLTGIFVSLELDENTANTFYTIVSDLPSGTYYWRVRATDGLYNWGSWSEVWSFTIDTDGPEPPDLSTPTNTAVTDDDTPYLDWLSVADAVEYEIELAETANFGATLVFSTTTASDYYAIFFSLDDGIYYWRVRARDSADNWGNWSEVWSFSIDTEPPVINSPEDIEYEVGETGNNFSWNPQDDNPSSFIIYLDDVEIQSGVWNSSSEELLIIVDGLSVGIYNYTIYVVDSVGNSIIDTVIVTVIEVVIPEIQQSLSFILPVFVAVGIIVWLKKKRNS